MQDNIKSVRINQSKTGSITMNENIDTSVQLKSNADKLTNKEQHRSNTSILYSKSDIQKQHILTCINWYRCSWFTTFANRLLWVLKLKVNWIK